MVRQPVLAIVQARMGSTRYPGKCLAAFGSSTVLQEILHRMTAASTPLELWVATTDQQIDDPLVDLAEAEGALVHRGSTDDVLSRFAGCHAAAGGAADLVLRVCADRPLLCPELIDELVAAYDDLERPDYLSNNLVPSYPDGLDLELIRSVALLDADRESIDPYEREHVTPFVYRRPERYRLAGLTCPFGNFAQVRVALDTPEDHERLVSLRERLPVHFDHRDLLTAAVMSLEAA